MKYQRRGEYLSAAMAAVAAVLSFPAAAVKAAGPDARVEPPPAATVKAKEKAAVISGGAAAAAAADRDQTPVTPKIMAAVSAVSAAHHKNGDTAVASGDMLLAAKAFAQAAEAAPREPVFRLTTGVALAGAGQNAFAVAQFRHAVRLAEEDVVAAMLLWGALSEKGETAETQALHREIVRRFAVPGRPGLDTSGSVARLGGAIQRFPQSAVLHMLLGDAFYLSESWNKAEQAYRRAVLLAPNWSKPLVNLGLAQLARGNANLAIHTFQAALNRDPNNTQAQLAKADAQLQSGRNRDALKTYGPLNQLPKVAAQAATGMGQAFANNGQVDEAIRSLGRARKLAPNDPVPAAALGEVQLKAGNYNQAAEAYQAALRLTRAGGLFSTRPILYRALAESQLSAGKPGDALVTLERARRDEPENASLWHRLTAQAHFARKDAAQAETALRRALDADSALYPLDTLYAIAANGLLERIVAAYRADLITAESGVRGSSGGSLSITSGPAGGPLAQVRALTALAHLARYREQFDDELRLRQKIVTLRTNASSDWFLLAETYDTRRNDGANASAAYRKALELGGLSAAAANWARSRITALTPAAAATPRSANP